MAKIYNCPYLILQHHQTNTLIGKELFQNVQVKYLAEAVLTFLDAFEDLEKIKKLMIKISCDGEIDESEKDDWNQIMIEINNVIEAGIALKFAK